MPKPPVCHGNGLTSEPTSALAVVQTKSSYSVATMPLLTINRSIPASKANAFL